MKPIPVLQLTRVHLPALRRHFLALPPDDLRLRFGRILSEAALLAYVDAIDFGRDAVFGVVDEDLELLGVAHLGVLGEAAEFGVSVLPGHRGRGIGSALFERCATYARTHGIARLFMHCLAENQSIMRIARRAGMDVVLQAGEAEGQLELSPSDPATVVGQWMSDRLALFDYALKSQWVAARRMTEAVADAAGIRKRAD
ncbi:MAG: GNAT family N-acetyltransferase [Pseudomonadota bacterium]|jgi:hypothetical protein